MSPIRDGIQATAPGVPLERLTKITGSDNGYSNDLLIRNQTQDAVGVVWAGLPDEMKGQIAARFWSKVARSKDPHACWLWTASVTGSKDKRFRYGQFTFTVDGTQFHIRAHRLAWILTYGGIPSGLFVCHKCDVPRCCNPSDLFLGTEADNVHDAESKGRLVFGLGARKLSDAAYADILSTTGKGSGLALARKWGITPVHVSRIRHGKSGATYHASLRCRTEGAA